MINVCTFPIRFVSSYKALLTFSFILFILFPPVLCRGLCTILHFGYDMSCVPNCCCCFLFSHY